MSIRFQLPTPHPFFPRAIALFTIAVLSANCGGSSADEPMEDAHDQGANHEANHDNHANHDMGDGGDESCGGHGEWHGDHCHCDEGYIASEDEHTCVEDEPDVVMDMSGSPDMSGEPDISMTTSGSSSTQVCSSSLAIYPSSQWQWSPCHSP